MDKKTFLGFDVTLRKALWKEINHLGKQIEIQERHLISQQVELEELKDSNFKLSAQMRSAESAVENTRKDIARKDAEISKLRGQLARYKQSQDKNGRRTKKKIS